MKLLRGAAALPLAALPILLVPPASRATVWTVEPDGTGDFPTIQAAVDFASDGDEILLGDGTFSGSGNGEIDYSGKAITIRSTSGDPGSCTIAATYRPAFLFRSGEDGGSVLADLTLLRSGEYPCRGAIQCEGSSPTIRNLVLRDCRPLAIRCVSSSATFENLLIEGADIYTAISLHASDVVLRDVELRLDAASVWSRGIVSQRGSPTLENVIVRGGSCPAMSFHDGAPLVTGCLVEANTGAHSYTSGAVVLYQADATIESTSILGNGATLASIGYLGSGLAISSSSTLVRDCLIAGNLSQEGGGVRVSGTSSATFERCTIAGNEAQRGGGLHVSNASTVYLEGTIVWGNCATDLGADGYLGSSSSVVQAGCADLAPSRFEGPGSLILGGDVLTVDPLFCEPVACPGSPTTAGVYSLAKNSPALGHACGAIGALGQGCGATSLEPASWGRVKSLYLTRP